MGTGGTTGGQSCPAGSGGCPCYGNETCDPGFACDIPLQLCVSETCVDGQLGCLCDVGACEGELVCEAGLCGSAAADGTTADGSESTGRDGTTSTAATDTAPPDSTSGDTTSGGTDPTQVVLYFTPPDDFTTFGPSDEPMDFRQVADALCTSSLTNLATPCTQAVAIVSVGEDDSVALLEDEHGAPFGVPVFSDAGNLIAKSFSTLLAEGAPAPLSTLNVTYPGRPDDSAPTYLTGSVPGGDFDPTASCTGWTEPMDGQAAVGSSTEMDHGWLRSMQQVPCAVAETELLCMCWQ